MPPCHRGAFRFVLLLCALISPALAAPGDAALREYFERETDRLSQHCLSDIQSLDDWSLRKETYRQQLLEMLGLDPLPPKTGLQPVVTRRIEQEDFIVENLQFQSLPGLYVTGNLYLPKGSNRPAPAVLYVCGHARAVQNGVSHGNKTAYQHHGIWFARHGYACLLIDTIQLGELEGIHHGTYREGMWWWNSRGYTPAGVEAWNSVRALDYLATRPEVDAARFGVTGRSGGGAYSWWLAAIDSRVKAAAPVAGITDLHNHVVDGVVEGHCDCMFIVNTHQWDYALVAALVAPRPLLLCNSDKDSIFPLDGVLRVHQKLRHIYSLHGAANNLGLLITEGPHKDTQDLQIPVFRWFNRHLKDEDSLIALPAEKMFPPEQLKVFKELPADERTRTIHESFVAAAPRPPLPASSSEWQQIRQTWTALLLAKSFAAWPSNAAPVRLQKVFSRTNQNLRLTAWTFETQPSVPVHLFALEPADAPAPKSVSLEILDDASWNVWLSALAEPFKEGFDPLLRPEQPSPPMASPDALNALRARANESLLLFFAPRGAGLNCWNPDPKKQVQIRRRFMLLGQTLDGMRVWDIRRTLQAVRSVEAWKALPLSAAASHSMAANLLYATLFEPPVNALRLDHLPSSHRHGPDYLNVLRILDIPQAVAMAADRSPITLLDSDARAWEYPLDVAKSLDWPARQLHVAAP